MGPQFIDYLVDTLTEVPGFEVSARFWALILLTSIIICIDALVVREVYILFLALILGTLIVFKLVLVLLVVRELIQIILVFMPPVIVLAMVLHETTVGHLFGMNSSLIYH